MRCSGLFFFSLIVCLEAGEPTYPIVDTGLLRCYDDRNEIVFPAVGEAYFGQDANYEGNAPSYVDNGDGTVTDRVTGLMWQRNPGPKMTLTQALAGAGESRLGGHQDWRVPTIKELYSLILFTGTDPDPMGTETRDLTPFIDTRYFPFRYGDAAQGERIIDSQYGSSTRYVSTTMMGDPTVFGVNFADGRIKGYGLRSPRGGGEKTFYFMYVRGNPQYGRNQFRDHGDGTLTDAATGLMWMQVDSGGLGGGGTRDGRMDWGEALAWSEGLTYAGHDDWRLPNIKELQSIIDYSRSPKTTHSAALDPLFKPSTITDEGKGHNFPFYWSSSSHLSVHSAQAADYMAVGEALGWMRDRRSGHYRLLDVHGAGAQRSDPKSGDPDRFPYGRGPQGDVIRIRNFAVCCRGGKARVVTRGPALAMPVADLQPARVEDRGRPSFVARLDRNGDGKVSRDEFDGPAHHFGTLDRNRDGFLSEDEAPRGPPPRVRGVTP